MVAGWNICTVQGLLSHTIKTTLGNKQKVSQLHVLNFSTPPPRIDPETISYLQVRVGEGVDNKYTGSSSHFP